MYKKRTDKGKSKEIEKEQDDRLWPKLSAITVTESLCYT